MARGALQTVAAFGRANTILDEVTNWVANIDFQPTIHDPHGYRKSYFVLRNAIRDKVDFESVDEILLASYAVYGWMPTILKWTRKLEELGSFVRRTRNLRRDKALHALSDAISTDPEIFTALNGTVVGTSKLLHFAVPNVYPILDGKIATFFGIQRSKISAATYLAYVAALHEWLDNGGNLPDNILAFANEYAPSNDKISRIRAVEFALFMKASE